MTTDQQPHGGREQDLKDALEALLKHYKRHVKHRCEIVTNAEVVLAGEPLLRFDYD
jgi:hypothetical protein